MALDITPHAAERLASRFTPAEAAEIVALTAAAADIVGPDVACAAMRLPYREEPDGSNGDMAVAVVRGGWLVTVMLRRSTQRLDPMKLGVARVAVAC